MKITAETVEQFKSMEEKVLLLGNSIQEHIDVVSSNIVGIVVDLNEYSTRDKISISKELTISYINVEKEDTMVIVFEEGIFLNIKKDQFKLLYFNA